MRALMTVDVGGTSIKFGYYANHQLHRLTDCPTPATLADYYRVIAAQKDALAGDFNLVGVAVSSPGAVNKKTGVIEGSSAIDYIHNFPIRQQLAQRLKTRVSLENDANCAGLGESFFGAGKDCHTIVAIVVGSGVGGAIVEDHRVRHGSHLFGGEFGYMIMRPTSGATLSHLVSPVAAAKAFSKKVGMPVTGKELFARAHDGDRDAQQFVDQITTYLALACYNLQNSFDPDRIIIGGAVSANPVLLPAVKRHIAAWQEKNTDVGQCPEVVISKFHNQANQLGAVVDFCQSYGLTIGQI